MTKVKYIRWNVEIKKITYKGDQLDVYYGQPKGWENTHVWLTATSLDGFGWQKERIERQLLERFPDG